MDAEKEARLEAAGIDLKSALERFMGNEAMLEKYLGRFLNEKSYMELVQAVADDESEAAGRAVHTLKSVCGSLGFGEMQTLVLDQEKAIRGGDWEKAKQMMPEIAASYDKICAALSA